MFGHFTERLAILALKVHELGRPDCWREYFWCRNCQKFGKMAERTGKNKPFPNVSVRPNIRRFWMPNVRFWPKLENPVSVNHWSNLTTPNKAYGEISITSSAYRSGAAKRGIMTIWPILRPNSRKSSKKTLGGCGNGISGCTHCTKGRVGDKDDSGKLKEERENQQWT